MIRRVIGCPFGRSRSNSLREISVRVEDFELGNCAIETRRLEHQSGTPFQAFPRILLTANALPSMITIAPPQFHA